jgi:CheY-like chemotaxis protein
MAHLLIVEDDPVIQRSLIRALRDHICVVASNGLEALRMLGSEAFDLVITDVDMPIMNGVDFYRRARKLFPALQIIFRTGSKVPDLASLGAPVLSKEWPLSTVLDAVDSYCGLGGVSARDVGKGQAVSEVGGR